MPTLIDTNILLRLRDSSDPHHGDCRRLLEAKNVAQFGLVTCAQVIIEYWVVATRPVEQNGFGLNTDEAAADIASFLEMCPCLPEPPDIVEPWSALVTRHRVLGKAAHDARIAALAITSGIHVLVTLNRSDFARFPEIQTILPSELLIR